MSRRRLLGGEDEPDSDSENSVILTPQTKKRRTDNVEKDDTGRSKEISLEASNDSGFLSAPSVTPARPSKVSARNDLVPLNMNHKGRSSIAGMIKRIRLKNFMCHGNLDVTLSKNVNFITGRNGSGKSAILAGLVLGLGGKPASLGRGHTAKAYVRTGNDRAEILITFFNTGLTAYQRDVYGKEITVERTMFASGRSTYKLKDEHAIVKSERREDILPILRTYNFQVDNPIMILSQDTSRTFLSQVDPKKLYAIFYRGTQLDVMDASYEIVVRNQQSIDDAVRQYEQMVAYLAEEIQSLLDRIKLHEDAQKNRDRLRDLAGELGWARVRDAEKELIQFQRQLDEKREKEQTATNDLDVAKAKEKELEEKIAKETERFEVAKNSRSEFSKELETIKAQLDNSQKDERKKKMEMEKLQKEKVELEAQRDALKGHIRKMEDEQMDDERRQHRSAKETELQQVKQEKEQLVARQQGREQERNQWQNSWQANTSRSNTLKLEADNLTRQLNRVRSTFDNLDRSRSNALARFGPQAPILCQAIDQAAANNQFRRRPRGPIGTYLSLKDDRYAIAVESCLGRALLGAYVCHDFNDNRLLESIMQRCGCGGASRPTIYVRNFGDERSTYDVSSEECRSQYPNVLSVLNITDNVVRNLLIDQRRIEAVLLFENEAEMRDVMRYRAPNKSSSAYGIEGGNFVMHPTYRYYPPQLKGGSRYLVKSVEDQLQCLNLEIKTKEAEINRLNKEISDIEKQTRSEQQQQDQCDKAIEKCKRQIQQADRKIRTLEDEINDLQPSNVGIHDMVVELERLEQGLTEVGGFLANADVLFGDARAIVEKIQRQLKKKMDENKALSDQLVKLQQLVDNLTVEKNRQHSEFDKKQRFLINVKREIQNFSGSISEKEKENEKLLKEAQDIKAERDQTERDCNSIELEMRRIDKSLALFEQDKENLKELVRDWEEKRGRKTNIQNYLDELKAVHKVLATAIRVREEGYPAIRFLTEILVKMKFVQYLSARGFSGKLRIDRGEQQLTILVEPRKECQSQGLSQGFQRRTSKPKDLRGLSGGERSFATVAFIMALWHVIETPNCWMDEFDVFMDQYTRRMVMELLIKFALEERPDYQFVFLTPQSLSELPIGRQPGLSVCELKAPRENQKRGLNND